MALEASDRLTGGVPVDVFQGLPSNSVPHCLTSWENQKKSAKTSGKKMFFFWSSSSLGAISKCLKVPRSSVQTIVCQYKHHGTKQPSYRSGRRRILSPRDERTLVQKCKSIPEQQQRTLWRYWRKHVAQQGRSHCSKTTIKKPHYGLQLHMGTKIVLFGEMSSGLMKHK